MSLVFNAKPMRAQARASKDLPSAADVSCADVAQRWLAAGQKDLPPEQLAAWLRSDEGPLSGAMLNSSQIMRLELNMQVLRLSASTRRDFGGHAEYLLKIFKWDPATSSFQESKMENQIDRATVLADRPVLRQMAAHRPQHLRPRPWPAGHRRKVPGQERRLRRARRA